jgi:putative membrane protein
VADGALELGSPAEPGLITCKTENLSRAVLRVSRLLLFSMVVTNTPKWTRILKQIGGLLATIFLLAVLSVLLDYHHLLRAITIPEMTVSVLGAALGILLAFRTNSAYARWWEARILWGALVNSSRSLAREALSFPRRSGSSVLQEASTMCTKCLIYDQIAFVHAMRLALRKQPVLDGIRPFISEEEAGELQDQQNIPAALLLKMGRVVSTAVDQHVLSELNQHRMDQTLSDLSNILGGCERIKNTPLPRQYDVYPELLIKIYCVLLPFIIVDEVGILTPLVTVIVGFAFLVLNRIGKNLEDPFENTVYDVPLTALSKTIEINLRQALGETQLPTPEPLVDGVLM